MDLSFNSRMEAYYQKFIELQEKLRNSEEERLKLEMKFNEMVQEAKEEEQMHYKKLRSQYKRFLEEDKKRQERNERIIRNLERIEARIGMLTSKTERFKILRGQYQSYLQRILRSKPSTRKQGYQPAPRIVVDAPYTSKPTTKLSDEDDNDNSLETTNDEKLVILDRYLQSLSSQKPKETSDISKNTSQFPHSDLQYLKDFSRKLDNSFDSNEANSIAEDIMNSIYSRHYKKEPTDNDLKPNKLTIPNYNGNDVGKKFSHIDGYNKHPPNLSNADYLLPSNIRNAPLLKGPPFETHKMSADDFGQKPNYYGDNNQKRDSQYMHSNDSPPILHSEKEIVNPAQVPQHQITTIKSDVIDFNKNKSNFYLASYTKDKDNTFNLNKNAIGSREQENVKDSTNIKLPIDSFKVQENLGLHDTTDEKEKDPEIEENSSKSDFSLSKSEIDVIQNEKGNEKNECIVKEDQNTGEYNDRDDIQVAKPVEETVNNEKLEECIKEPASEATNIIRRQHDNIVPDSQGHDLEHETNIQKEMDKPGIKKHQVESRDIRRSPNDEEEDDREGYITKISEITVPVEQEVEQKEQKENVSKYKEDTLDSEEIENRDTSQPEVQAEIQDNIPDQYSQYDQVDQPEQFAAENVPQYDDNQYNASQEQGVYYEGEHPPQQYTEDGQNVQQYYDDGQTELYDQQNDNQTSQYYEQNGDYQTNTQNVHPYDQQYDGNGQPLYQYNENGQIIQQYDENGQVIPQYDENGQPIMYNQQYNENDQQILHDENGQPIVGYGENQGEYEYQQYDETGQSGYQYNADAVPQYDENGQPLCQEYGGTDGQYEGYQEGVQNPEQIGEGCDIPQEYVEASQSEVEQPRNDEEVVENIQETEDTNGDKLRDESSVESVKNVDDDKEKGYIAEENVKDVQKGKNVLDMLDTDTESAKQNTSKISNDSDFDFSNT